MRAAYCQNATNRLVPATDENGVPKPSRRLVVSTNPVDFAETPFDENTDVIVYQVRDGSVIVTFDGTNPNMSNGHPLAIGINDQWNVHLASAAKLVRASGSDATVIITEWSYLKTL